MNIWVVSTLEILWIMVLWVYVCRFLCEHVFSCLLSISLRVEWLDHMVTPCLNFWGIFKLLSKMTTYQWCMRVPISPHPCQPLLLPVFFFFFIRAILVDMTWHLMWFPYTFKYSYYEDSWAISPLKVLLLLCPWVHPSLVSGSKSKEETIDLFIHLMFTEHQLCQPLETKWEKHSSNPHKAQSQQGIWQSAQGVHDSVESVVKERCRVPFVGQ